MARSIPTPSKLKMIRVDILRSIYYKQELPRSVFSIGAAWMQAEFTTLTQSKLIAIKDERYILTDTGLAALKKLAGGRVPGMIRMDRSIFMSRRHKEKFIVDRSLAKEIFREVSADG